MIKEKFNNKIGINYFYELFKKRKTAYSKRYYFLIGGRTKKIELSKSLFKSLVSTYFNIYFTEFYTSHDDLYFPLSGSLKKTRGKGFYKNQNSAIKTESIIWLWYLRPAFNYVTNLKIIKLKGNTAQITKLENEYKEMNDVGLLPNVISELTTLNNKNKLYAQW